MSHLSFGINFFVALFALIDPVGNVALFAAATAGAKAKDRAQIAFYISLFVMGFLAVFYLSGLRILAFFGISLAAFRIAGGVILLLLGLEMVRDDFTAKVAGAADSGAATGGRAYVRQRLEQMIVPFAMPLLIGPGAISTAVIYASQAKQYGLEGAGLGLGAIAAVSASTFLCFLATPLITRILGRIGLTIVVRVLGLILCALAVQFLLAGLADTTTGFIRPAVAIP